MSKPSAISRWQPYLPAAIVVAAGIAFGAAFLLIPSVGLLARTAGSILNTEEVGSVRIFLGTWGRGSALSVVILAVWQAVLVPLPYEALIRGAASVFGPVVGALSSWIGLVLGALAMFGIGRASPECRSRRPGRVGARSRTDRHSPLDTARAAARAVRAPRTSFRSRSA